MVNNIQQELPETISITFTTEHEISNQLIMSTLLVLAQNLVNQLTPTKYIQKFSAIAGEYKNCNG